jgi:Uma2 family endonuclease
MSTGLLPERSSFQSRPPRAWPDDLLLTIPASAHTLAGFRAWVPTLPERTRVTFFAGEVLLDMSNEDVVFHTKVKGEIFAVLYQLNKEINFGEIYQDGSLLTNVTADVSNNPDAVAALWKTIDEGRFRVVERAGHFPEMEGTPDWVLEVVSPSSVGKDKKLLRTAYHAAGIPEYWLVDARGPEIEFTVLQSNESGYVAATNDEGWQASKIFGRAFRLMRTKDARGFFIYDLQVRAV